MPDSAEKFIDLLEQRKLLPQVVIDSIRRQVSAAPDQFNAHHVAKLLQRKGKITPFQARELLAELQGRDIDGSSEAATGEPAALDNPGELGLADEEEDKPITKSLGKKASKQEVEPPPVPPPAPEPSSLAAGMEELLDDPLMDAQQPDADPLRRAPQKKGWGGKKLGKRKAGDWDSPLIIVGGGLLLLLLLIAGVLMFVLTRGSGDELYAAAEQDYLDGAYAQSIAKFEKFAAGHASHPKASMARVRVGLARIRLATSAGDWAKALSQAQSVLPTIETEAAFADARAELAALLPDIAQGFADQAAQLDDLQQASAVVEQYRQSMELVDNPVYLPASQRVTLNARLERTEEEIAGVVRQIEEQSRLQETIAGIQSQIAEGDPLAAYAQRDALLKLYPRLTNDGELTAAVTAASAKLANLVEVSTVDLMATEEDRPSPIVGEAPLARISGGRIDTLEGHVVPMLVDGVLYGLAADDGRLLWRRYVGRDTTQVIPVDATAGSDVLVTDTTHHDLLRLSAADGKLVWRLPVGSPFELTLAGDRRLLVAVQQSSAEQGEIWDVDVTSGGCTRAVRFPQPITARPIASESGRIYQVANRSNVYVLEEESLRCQGVYYLGHKPSTIEYPPVAIAGILILPHQAGLRRAQLHILREIDEPPLLSQAQTALSLSGQLANELVTEELYVAAVADDYSVTLAAADPAKEAPLEKAAQKPGGTERGSAHAVMNDGYLMVSNRGLASYRVSSARGGLTPHWANHSADTLVGPLHVIDNYLFHARQRPNQAGVVVAATPLDSDEAQNRGRPVWETVIAPGAPEAGMRFSPDTQRLVAFCSTGDAYELPVDLATSAPINAPTTAARLPGDYELLLQLDNRRALLVGKGGDLLMIGEEALGLDVSPGSFAYAHFSQAVNWRANELSWRAGLLAPTSLGQIVLVGSQANQQKLHPFQPRLIVGQPPRWLRPAVVDNARFLAASRAGDLYLVGLSEDRGVAYLGSTSQVKTAHPPVAAPLYDGQAAVLITRSDHHDLIERFDFPALEPADPLELPGRLRWGPFAIGDAVLLLTRPGGLQAYDRQGQLLWSNSLAGQRPVGAPQEVGDNVVIATTAGKVFKMGTAEGDVTKQFDLAQPLADGPLALADRIALRAADGSILFIAHD